MSASLKFKGGVLAGALSCLVAGLAVAQQLQQAPGTQPRPGQPGQSGQRDRVTTQSTQQAQPAQRGQQYTAEFRGTQTAGASTSQEIENYLANCLLIKNQAEVELSQFAQQKAQSPEVKEFAQMLVKDHQQAIQKLQALAGAQGAAGTSQRTATNTQFDAQAAPPATERPRQALNQQDGEQSLTTTARPGRQNDALSQLAELDRQISERCQEMVREELQAKSGPEFDHCFVAAQIGSHTHMLAALDVLGQRSQGELRQFVQQAQPVVQRHLEHAKQIAKTQYQAQRGNQPGTQQAERQPGQTQQR
jgi:predicted outer membrane protein